MRPSKRARKREPKQLQATLAVRRKQGPQLKPRALTAPTCARLVQPSLSVMIQPPFPSAPTAETPWLRPGASQEISVPIL